MLTDMDAGTIEPWRPASGRWRRQPLRQALGLGTSVHRNDPAPIALVVERAIAILGTDRLMFGSNLPIESLCMNGGDLIAAHRAAVALHGEKAEADIFRGTAERVYRPA